MTTRAKLGAYSVIDVERRLIRMMYDPLVLNGSVCSNLRDRVEAGRRCAEPDQEGAHLLTGELALSVSCANVAVEVTLSQNRAYL